jgi:hypothetical protein
VNLFLYSPDDEQTEKYTEPADYFTAMNWLRELRRMAISAFCIS